MTTEFDDEQRQLTETVARPRSNPSVGLAAVLIVATALVLGLMWYAALRKRAPQNASDESFRTARVEPGSSFAPPPPPDTSKIFIPPPPPVVTPPPAPPSAPIEPAAIIVPPLAPATQAVAQDDSEARREAELEQKRKEEEAKRQARLRSPMLIVNEREGNASVDGAARVGAVSAEGDSNRKFLNDAEGAVVTAHAQQSQRIDALVPQGYMIKGVLEAAIQSDLPGMVRASTSEDVYSFDGRRVLIPKGTMLTGEYRSGILRGQTRVFVVWTRMLRADGVSLMLGSYGTDQFGRSGLTGDVDNHFLQRFGGAALLTITGGVAQFVAALGNLQNSQPTQYVLDPTTNTLVPLNAVTQNQIVANGGQIAAQSMSQGITKMAEMALSNDINIPPTINVDQGTRIIVFVKRDLDFSDLYPDPVKEALYELRHPGKARRPVSVGDAAGLLPPGGEPNPPISARY
jgi:type IV secretion system protein VirB10